MVHGSIPFYIMVKLSILNWNFGLISQCTQGRGLNPLASETVSVRARP